MISVPYYYNTIRKVTVAFGTIFNEMKIIRDNGQVVQVPLQYASKEQFISIIMGPAGIDDQTKIQETLPRMGFEMTGMNYASERKTNTMEKIVDRNSSQPKYMFNRVPYDINFTLFIATRKLDDSFRIVEQILPYFTPELTVKIIDKEDYGISTNVPFILNSTSYQVDAEGDPLDRRTVLWQLEFTAKAYLYAATRDTGLIKKTIVDLSDINTERFYEEYRATVTDPDNKVVEEITDEKWLDGLISQATAGNNSNSSM